MAHSLCRLQADLRKLIPPSAGRAPEELGLGGVELKAVSLHLHSIVINARSQLLLELGGCCRTAKSIDLRVIGVVVWTRVVMPNQLQKVHRVQKEQYRSQNSLIVFSNRDKF